MTPAALDPPYTVKTEEDALFAEEMKAASIVTDKVSPLLLPTYTHGNPKHETH